VAERPFGRCDPSVPIDQGYIFANVPFPAWGDGGWKPRPALGVVTSQECACEDYIRALEAGKGNKARKIDIQVAPLQSARQYPAEAVEKIEAGEYPERFFIYGGQSLPDSVVLVDKETAIPAHLLATLTPVTVLAPWQWRRLVIHLTVSQWHELPEKILHPDLLRASS
jgi:hypothetical protein